MTLQFFLLSVVKTWAVAFFFLTVVFQLLPLRRPRAVQEVCARD